MTSWPELLLRFVAGVTLSAASGYLLYSLHRRHVRPRNVWLYLALTVCGLTLFRWVVFWEATGWLPESLEDDFLIWQAPINQAFYAMLGFAVILLVRAHIVGIRNHYLRHGHE